MNPLSIIGLVASGAKALGGLGQGLFGLGKSQQLWRNRPQLGVTEGEKQNDALYNQMASATEMPGQRQAESKLGEAYAGGVYDVQRGANSSVGATQGAIDLAGKKMSAIRDLGGMFAEYKQQRQDALAGWNKQKTELEQQRFQTNEYDPWMMQYGKATGNAQQGFNTFGSGADTGLGILGDLAGTEQYMALLKKLYPNLGK